MSEEYIDIFLSQVDKLGHVTFTGGEPSLNVEIMQYFVDKCKSLNIPMNSFALITNGINIKQDFIDVCIDLYQTSVYKYDGCVSLSNDVYHVEQKRFDESLLQTLPFYRRRSEIRKDVNIIREGRAKNLKEANRYGAGTSAFTSIQSFEKNYITLNVHGEIINGIDWSYDNQKHHRLCKVENLTKFYNYMTNNKFIKEDWERLSDLDKMYLIEREREIAEEWQQWEDEHHEEKLPAIIRTIKVLQK